MNLDPACNSFIVASHIRVPCLSTNKWSHAIDGTDPPLEGLYLLLIRVLVYHRYRILTWQVFSPHIQVPHICIIYLSLRNTAARRVATRLWPRRSQSWKWRRWRCLHGRWVMENPKKRNVHTLFEVPKWVHQYFGLERGLPRCIVEKPKDASNASV